jgi:hypothetical protein
MRAAAKKADVEAEGAAAAANEPAGAAQQKKAGPDSKGEPSA